MKRWASVVLATTLLAGPAIAQDDSPYVGVWDCGVAEFTFTRATYHNRSELMVPTDIEQDGNSFLMSFSDGYQIGVSINPDDTMQWVSMESGDTFDCTRLYR